MYNFRQFSTVRRKPEVIKKKYIIVIFIFLAKEKIDGIKRSGRKTGGGPPSGPSLTPCEEALMKSLEGRPVCSGVPGGGGALIQMVIVASFSIEPFYIMKIKSCSFI